jgi:guanosine-3',5'-bis(diphosphate) 3'-pyrophosphohydrolase
VSTPPKKLIRKLTAAARARKGRSTRTSKAAALAAAPSAAMIAPTNPFQALLRAASFAARKHQGQTRADNLTPYFSHVARVTLVLSHEFGVRDEDVLTAALLHDTIEDTATDYDEIATLFGARVADYVVLLTKNGMLPKKEREEDYIARLGRAPEPVMIAKMADLYDNLSDRIHSPKLAKTAATAQRLLGVFGRRLETPSGRAAHAKLSVLLNEVKGLRPESPTDVPATTDS